MNNNKESTEQDWLDAVDRVFRYAKTQKPAAVSRSEVESLIIGLDSLARTPKARQVLQMLQGYLDTMKKKNKKFLPIK